MAYDKDAKIKNIDEYRKQLAEVKNRLADIQKLEDKGLKSAISKKDTQGEILKLQAKINKEIAQQRKNAKAFNTIQGDVAKQQKNISKSILGSVTSLLKGNAAEAQTLSSKIKQSKTQTDLSKQAAKQASTLRDMRLNNQLSAQDYAKMLDLTSDLKDGTVDRLDIEDNLAGLSEEGYKNVQSLKTTLDDIGAQKEEEVKLIEEAEEAEERRNKKQAISNTLAGVGVGIFTTLVALGTKFGTILDGIGAQFGSLDNLGGDIVGQLNASTVEAEKLGLSQSDILASTTMLSSEFGVSLEQAAGLSAEIADTAKATGLSVDEATKLTGELRIISGLSQEQSEALIEGTSQLAKQAGVAPQAVLKDIAGSSETIATFTKQGGENLFEAAVQARMFGLNLDSVAKAARSTLDFESSIAAEVEASVMLGKQLNLQKAREAALNKDLVGFQKEIKNQLGGIGDFNKLNVFQQESLAKALGMSVSEVAKLSSGTEKLSVAGALAAGGFEDLAGQEALSNLSSITNEVKALFTEALILIGPEIENLASTFRDFLQESGGLSFLKDTFLGVANGIKNVIQYVPALIGLMVSLKVASTAAALAATIQAIAASASVTPFLLGAGGVAAGLAIAGAIAYAKNAISVDDFKSSPGGITHMTGPAGTFKLNPKDSVLATTNSIPVNDVTTGPAGSMNVGGMNSVVEAVDNVQRAIKELTISTSVTSNQLNIVLDGGLGGD